MPTTYAGSEMTTIYGLTDAGMKTTGRDARVLPRTVVYDPELSLGAAVRDHGRQPAQRHRPRRRGALRARRQSARRGDGRGGHPHAAAALPRLQRDPGDLAARGDALVAAWLCGTVLGSITIGLHHKLCHTLGGSFDLPHAEVHAVVLPHAMAYNAPAAPGRWRGSPRALGAASAPGGAVRSRPRARRADLAGGDRHARADLDRAAGLAVQNAYPNPRPLERAPVRDLLQRAFDGARPD